MHKIGRLLLLSLGALVLIGGCGDVRGYWILRQHQPYLEKSDYKIVKLAFYENGSFEGIVSQNDETHKIKGMYDYCPCSEELTLMAGDKVLCYKARRVSDKMLYIDMCGPDSIDTRAVMVRYFPCPYRPPCHPCPSPCSDCQ